MYDRGFDSRWRQEIFISETSRCALPAPSRRNLFIGYRRSSPKVKRPGREANHPSPSVAKVRNE
jgi:hypothetical protein